MGVIQIRTCEDLRRFIKKNKKFEISHGSHGLPK